MHSEDEFARLVGQIYDAAVDPAKWPLFLTAIADSIGGTTSVLLSQDRDSRRADIAVSVRLDPRLQREYETYYASRNLWLIKGRPLLKTGRVVTAGMVCSDAEFERTEYCNDYLRPLDLFYSFGAVANADAGASSILTSFRPKRNGPFEGEDLKLLEALLPHLRRALQVHKQLIAAELHQAASLAALDRLVCGIVLVAANGRVTFTNRAALAIVNGGDGLRMRRDGSLGASVARVGIELDSLIARARDGHPPDAHPAALHISRPSGKRDLITFAISLRAQDVWQPVGSAADVMLVVNDRDALLDVDSSHMERLHGFTPAEARVAARLIGGLTVAEIAARLETTPHTVRWHLKHIFQKTETRSQADLIRHLLVSGAPHLL